MKGWYAEAAYDVFNSMDWGEKTLTLFIRYEEYDTQAEVPSGFDQNGKYDIETTSIGVSYQPIDEIVFKLEHQFIEDGNGSENDQTNLGMGYVF